jgi:hypothetical protein
MAVTSAWWRLPDPFPPVVSRFASGRSRGPPTLNDGPDSRFPIALASLTQPDREMGLSGARDRVIEADGLVYTATVIIGSRAAPTLRTPDRAGRARAKGAVEHEHRV